MNIRLVIFCAALLSTVSCKSNNVLLGRVEHEIQGHNVVVTDCYRLSLPSPQPIKDPDAPGTQWTPCRDADIQIRGRELIVNGEKYSGLNDRDSITIDHGRVLINDRPAAKATSAGSREGFIRVTGGKVWYRISGEGQPGVPLIALHGGPGADHSCLAVVDQLSDERPVVLYDQLGGGKSDHPKDKSLWTVERFVKELAAVRTGLGLNQVHILGHSWGTMLAAEYMLSERPSGVRSLILSGPCFSSPRWIADQRAYLKEFPPTTQKTVHDAEAAEKYDSPEYKKAIDEFYRRHFCRISPWPDCLDRPVNMDVYGYMWGPSEFTATGTLKDFDITSRVHDIKVPVLFTCGRYDEANPKTTAYYQSLIPGSKMVVIEDAAHMHMDEKPAEYLRVVREFLRQVEKK